MEIETMPKQVTVIKSVTYDVEQIISDLAEQGMKEPTFQDALGMIEEYAKDDFSCGHGHEGTLRGLTFIDPDTGEEI